MWAKHNSERPPIYDVRLSRLISLSTTVYELTQFVRVKLMSISNGPLEVRHSLSVLKITKTIIPKRLAVLPKEQLTWVGSGYITRSAVDRIIATKPKRLVLGPNLEIFNPYVRELLDSTENSIFLVPCDWVKTMYVENLGISPKKVAVWVAGIDTSEWLPRGNTDQHVLIFVKGPFVELAQQISQRLTRLGFDTSTLEYGSYAQNDYRCLLGQSQFAIFLNGTESQGIAHFQAWSMNIPTLILNNHEHFDPRIQNQVVRASSSPYLTTSTGMFFELTDIWDSLNLFISKLEDFRPRDWVIKNYDVEISAQRFLQLFHSN